MTEFYTRITTQLNKATNIAVKNTCNRALGKLQELIISEFYDAYDPQRPELRTMQFYNSAVTQMISKCVGEVFMNPDLMNYSFSGWGWSWDGQTQLEAANQGIHGGWSTPESLQHRYWDAFIEWCDKNILLILREELIKQHVPLK